MSEHNRKELRSFVNDVLGTHSTLEIENTPGNCPYCLGGICRNHLMGDYPEPDPLEEEDSDE